MSADFAIRLTRARSIADGRRQLTDALHLHRPLAGKLLVRLGSRLQAPRAALTDHSHLSLYCASGKLRHSTYPPCQTRLGGKPNTTAKLASTRSGDGPISLARPSTSSPTNSERKRSGRQAWTKSATRLPGFCAASVKMASTRRLMSGARGRARARKRNRRY